MAGKSSRGYPKEWAYVPSVTEVISEVWNKGEAFWRWKLTRPDAGKTSHAAAKKGSRIHSSIAKIIGGKRTRLPKESKGLDENIKNFFKGKRILLSERPLLSDLGFKGTPDLVFSSMGANWLTDYKTGKLRDEQFIQLGGYRILCEENGIPINKNTLTFIRGSSITTMDSIADTDYSEIFLHCLGLYQWKLNLQKT